MPDPDPGWNDPPTLSFGAAPAKRGSVLNKRVAFPLGPGSARPASGPVPSVPGAPPPCSVHRAGVGDEASRAERSHHRCDQDTVHSAMASFREAVDNLPEHMQKNKEDIWRRLDIMKKMWEDDQLGPQVCEKILHLSNALASGDGTLADQIHVGLMVEHVAVCSPWMTGVRALIHQAKATQAGDS
ncbi:steroid receptor RNA activator 1-like isoform X2 [Bacillus rossius redtenbacheri]